MLILPRPLPWAQASYVLNFQASAHMLLGFRIIASCTMCTLCVLQISLSHRGLAHTMGDVSYALGLSGLGPTYSDFLTWLTSDHLKGWYWHWSPTTSSVCRSHCLFCHVAHGLFCCIFLVVLWKHGKRTNKRLNPARGSINLIISSNWNKNGNN